MIEIWFAILCFMLATFAILDGWDIGCGAVHFLVAKTPAERRMVVSALGPLWSWHEVWLVAAGGVLFVAFPGVLAAALSGFYLAVIMLLWCLVLRGLALEFGSHLDDPMWRSFWDAVFALASVLLAVLLGAALGNLMRGVPLDASGKFSLSFFTDFGVRGNVGILDWYTLSVSLFTLVCLSAHGASYLVLKTEGPVHDRALALARRLWLGVFAFLAVITLETGVVRPELFTEMARRPLAELGVALAMIGAAAIVTGQIAKRERAAFAGGCAFIAGVLGAAAASVFPVMLPSTLGSGYSVTAYAGTAGGRGLGLALAWWPLALAFSIAYFAFVLRHYRGKIRPAAGAR